jgi:hypothetical protein
MDVNDLAAVDDVGLLTAPGEGDAGRVTTDLFDRSDLPGGGRDGDDGGRGRRGDVGDPSLGVNAMASGEPFTLIGLCTWPVVTLISVTESEWAFKA